MTNKRVHGVFYTGGKKLERHRLQHRSDTKTLCDLKHRDFGHKTVPKKILRKETKT